MKRCPRAFVKAACAVATLLTVSCIVLLGDAANAITPGATPSFGVLGAALVQLDALITVADITGILNPIRAAAAGEA